MKVVVTGAEGFLGWHLRCRLRALTDHEVVPVGRADLRHLPHLAAGADAVVHVAGVNRGEPDEVERGNVELARAVADVVRGTPLTVVFANSIQAGNGTPYGTGKARAAELLADAARAAGTPFVDVRLPNLFGEHGRAHYNSFVATFAAAVASGEEPFVDDKPVGLLHAQAAAGALMSGLDAQEGVVEDLVPHQTSVLEVLDKVREFRRLYTTGDVPPLRTQFEVDLFNTYRAALFPWHYPILLPKRSDARGDLVECARVHGGGGQSFVSTTVPGVTRGEHFHLGKVERFLVLRGRARIALRRLFSTEVVTFDVTGDEPAVVDMPTMWVHDITNTGDDELITFFWTHRVFDPAAPDTYPEPVAP